MGTLRAAPAHGGLTRSERRALEDVAAQAAVAVHGVLLTGELQRERERVIAAREEERRRLRLYLRQDEYGRYYSALVYLPRDRYTTGVRLRIIDILKEELGGTSVDFTAWNTESILSRLHFVVRVPQGTELHMRFKL